MTDKYAEHNALVKKLRLRTGPQQAKNFGGEAEVTFGNDNGVIDVQSIMMRPFCYDQLIKKMINSENRKLLHDYYQSHVLFHRKFFVNILAVAFLKVSDVKPIKQLILDISLYKKSQKNRRHIIQITQNNIHTDQIIKDFMTNTWRMEQGCSMSVSKI